MKFKKLSSLVLSVALICQGMMFNIANASDVSVPDSSITKTAVVNVARGKQVTATSLYTAGKTADKLTDGDLTTSNIVFSNGAIGNNLQIDLKNSYMPEKVRLYFGSGMGQWWNSAKNFKVVGSNTVNFDNPVVMYENVNALPGWPTDNGDRPQEAYIDVVLTNSQPARYIRIEKTDDVMFGYCEVEVYAKQTVTDVARGKTATASHTNGGGYSAEAVLNGENSEAVDTWCADYVPDEAFKYIMVDLGNVYAIDTIELEGAFQRTNLAELFRYDLYASKTGFDAVLNSTEPHLDINTYDLIHFVPEDARYAIPQFDAAPNYQTAYVSGGKYNTTAIIMDTTQKVDSVNEYQHIMLRHHKANEAASLGNLRAYAVNPVLNSVSEEGGLITLAFTTPMDITGKIITNLDTDETYGVTKVDDYTYTFKATDEGAYKININGITDRYGMTCYSDNEIVLVDEITAEEIISFINQITADGNETVVDKLEGLSVVGAKATASAAGEVIIVGVYDKQTHQLKNVSIGEAETANTVISTGVTLPTSGEFYVKAFLWSGKSTMVPRTEAKPIY